MHATINSNTQRNGEARDADASRVPCKFLFFPISLAFANNFYNQITCGGDDERTSPSIAISRGIVGLETRLRFEFHVSSFLLFFWLY